MGTDPISTQLSEPEWTPITYLDDDDMCRRGWARVSPCGKKVELRDAGGLPVDTEEWDWNERQCVQKDTSTCFLPDQYAIVWAWNGSGAVQSYDPLADAWTDHGNAELADGTVIGGYALAFKNDTTDPRLFFQRSGNLYTASPDTPTDLQLVGPANNSQFGSSYPCLAFDPAGRLLVGIGSGQTVGEINPNTGEVTTLGPLIDIRDGANLQAGPGDWFFDPQGRWFLMARDIRGATFGVSTGTVLWELDPQTLEATRIGTTEAPTSGTGAAWLAANNYLLSTSSGNVYVYNPLADTDDPDPDAWDLLTSAPRGINDLANQWVIPEALHVVGCVTIIEDSEAPDGHRCEIMLHVLGQDPVTGEPTCEPFPENIQGTFGKCEPDPNPFVSDPFSSADGGGGCEECPDEDWHEGCSTAGPTLWRRGKDPALVEYLFGNLVEPTTQQPAGFQWVPCTTVVNDSSTAWCRIADSQTIYERPDGTWFDTTGDIPAPNPADVIEGPCDSGNPLITETDTEICLNGSEAIRREIETYTIDPEGLPVLATTQIIFFNGDGTIWDSGVINAGDPFPPGQPADWTVGTCVSPYIDYENTRLCEIDGRFLLLVDSGGAFAKYSFYDGSISPVPIPVPSAGTGVDVANYLLYAFVSPDSMLTVDVNTNVIVGTTPLTTADGSPLAFSAASFDNFAGRMLAWAYGTDSVYEIDTSTGDVSYFSGPWTGISGTGSSFAVNPVDGKFYVSGSAGRVYEVDNTAAASGAAALVYDSPGNIANGMTFDTDGALYMTGGLSTFRSTGFDDTTEQQIIDDWAPGANSIAYYEVVAQQPSCFHRRFGILPNGDREIIGDYNVADDSPRSVAGDVDCCGTGCDCENGPAVPVDPCAGVAIVDLYRTDLGAGGGGMTSTNWEPPQAADDPVTLTGSRQIVAGWPTVRGFPAPPGPITAGPAPWADLNVNDTSNAAGVLDVQILAGYIVVPSATMFRYSGTSEGYQRVDIADCCGSTFRTIYERSQNIGGPGEQGDTVGVLPAGIHDIRVLNLDTNGTNSSAIFQTSIDGGQTWTSGLGGMNVSTSKPVEECVKARTCSDSGDWVDIVTGAVLDLSTLRTCPIPCAAPTATAAEIAAAIVAAERNVTPRIQTFVNQGAVQTLPVAPGTRGEIVSIEDFGAGLVRWTIDGTTPGTGNDESFTTTGPYHAAYGLRNIDLSLVRLDGSSNGSDYSVAWIEYP